MNTRYSVIVLCAAFFSTANLSFASTEEAAPIDSASTGNINFLSDWFFSEPLTEKSETEKTETPTPESDAPAEATSAITEKKTPEAANPIPASEVAPSATSKNDDVPTSTAEPAEVLPEPVLSAPAVATPETVQPAAPAFLFPSLPPEMAPKNEPPATDITHTPSLALPTAKDAASISVHNDENPKKTSDFVDALASAYVNNPRLKAEREALKSIDESVAQAISGYRPYLSAEFGKGRERASTDNQSWRYDNTTSKELIFTQPLFNASGTTAEVQAAKARVKAAQAQLQAVEQSVLQEAINAYADVVEKQSLLELSRNNVNVLREQVRVTQARFEVGELTRTDLAQSESRRARAEAEARQAEGDLASARAQFQRVIGYNPENLLLPPEAPALPASASDAVAEGQEQNPEIIRARFSEKAADKDINARVSNLLPNASLRGSMRRSDGGTPNINSLDNDSLTVNLSIPLYQSGAEYSRVREAKNRREEARFDTLDTLSSVTATVTRAWEDYQASLAVITSTTSAIKAAELALEGIKSEYDYGTRTTLNVLDAEQELLSNRVNLVRAQRNKTVNAYNLRAATGKLTAQSLKLPVEIYDPQTHLDAVKWKPVGF